jgi:hypothetical protein
MNPAVVNWKGCLSVRAAGDLASNTITVWEHWDSIESHDSYFAWRAERGDVDKYFLPLLGAAPSSQVLTSLF